MDGIQIHMCNINGKIINMFDQSILVKVKKNLRKPQAQFWERLRKLRLSQNYGFLMIKVLLYFICYLTLVNESIFAV